MQESRSLSKRARRWLLLALGLLATCWLFQHWLHDRISAKASLIRLGQTETEVIAILGTPDSGSSHPHSPVTAKLCYGSLQGFWDSQVAFRLATTIYLGKKCPFWLSSRRYPVEIGFDLNGRVNTIRIDQVVLR